MDENKNLNEKEVTNIIEDKKTKPVVSYGTIGSGNGSKQAKNVFFGMLGGIVGTVVISSIIFGLLKTNVISLDNILSDKDVLASQSDGANSNIKIEKVTDAPIAVAEKVGPAIVGIKVTAKSQDIFGVLQEGTGEGSGIVFKEDGYIVTNYHVIEAAYNDKNAKIQVMLPDATTELEATIIGGDKITDLAIIKIEKTGLKYAEFGDSSSLKVGEMVVAIGNPLGEEFRGSVTVGYVSALNRKVTTDGKTFSLIQTDAAINPGNSGGALVNNQGQVVGINSIKIGGSDVEGLGFAIPINDAKPIIEQLLTNKKIARPYIGIYGRNLDADTATKNNLVEGVYVSSVIEFSPAEKSGIKAGDVIIAVEGKTVKTMDEINEVKNAKKIGDKISLTVNRGGTEKKISITLEESQE